MLILWNIIFTLLFLILLYNLGMVFSKKIFNGNLSFTIPLGLVLLLSISHLILLPLTMLMSTYSIVKFVIIPIFLCILCYSSIYFFKNCFKIFLSRYSSKYIIFVDMISIIYGIYIFIFSTPYVDSWLYIPLANISEFSNYVFSTDGITPFTNWTHQYDTYYLFQSIMATISLMDNTLYLTTFFKFIEGFIVIQSLGMLMLYIAPRLKFLSFSISFVGIFCWLHYFTNSIWNATPSYSYEPIFLVQSGPTGTVLLYMVFIPLILIYVLQKKNIINHKLYLLILCLFGFSVSSSTIYMMASVICILLIMDIINKDTYEIRKYIPTVAVIAFESCVYIIWGKNNIIFIICSFIIICCCLLIYYIMTPKFSKFLYILFATIFTITVVAINFISLKTVDINGWIEFIDIKLFILMIPGIIYLLKREKNYLIFIFLFSLVFNNYLFNTFAMQTSLAPTYHRVVMISSTYLFNIVGFAYIINLVSKNRFVQGCVLLVFFIISSCLRLVHEDYNPTNSKSNIASFEEYSDFKSYKIRYNEVNNLSDNNFTLTNELYIPDNTNEQKVNFKSFFYLHPELTRVTACESECYYISNNFDEIDNSKDIIIDEYNSYYLVYRE